MKPARCYTWLFWSTAVVGLVLDQASKYGVFALLYADGRDGRHEVLGGIAADFSSRDGRCEGRIELIPGAFRLLAQYTGQHETGEGLGARLRTISSDMLPRVN